MQVERGRLKIKQIDGSTNTAHVVTNLFLAQMLTRLLRRVSVAFDLGRVKLALQHC